MFSNSEEENRDFCESYKSQILANDEREEPSLFTNLIKVFFILFLLVLIAGVSFYGYHNFMNNKSSNDIKLPPQSVQISDDDLMVTLEEPKEELKEKPIKEMVVEEKAIENIADEVKMEIAKAELQEEVAQLEEVAQSAKETSEKTLKEEHLEVPTSSPEAQYLEELAKLSDAIDKDRQ